MNDNLRRYRRAIVQGVAEEHLPNERDCEVTPYMPMPDDIRRVTAEIRDGWSETRWRQQPGQHEPAECLLVPIGDLIIRHSNVLKVDDT